MSDETKPDPWDELMEVAHTYAVDSYEDSKVCENCLGEWPHFEPEQHEPDCPVRPGRENPYAGLVTVARAYERWEADLILDNDAWGGGLADLPTITQPLWDRLLEIQAMRSAALAKAEGKS